MTGWEVISKTRGINEQPFSVLRTFASQAIEEGKLAKKDRIVNSSLSPRDFGWVINTQKRLNTYINEFQNRFYPKYRTAVEEQQLSELQAKVLIECRETIPPTGELAEEVFFPRLLQAMAVHNRYLAEVWDP